jgi:pseudouridine-5'-phosphate glycosidase
MIAFDKQTNKWKAADIGALNSKNFAELMPFPKRQQLYLAALGEYEAAMKSASEGSIPANSDDIGRVKALVDVLWGSIEPEIGREQLAQINAERAMANLPPIESPSQIEKRVEDATGSDAAMKLMQMLGIDSGEATTIFDPVNPFG